MISRRSILALLGLAPVAPAIAKAVAEAPAAAPAVIETETVARACGDAFVNTDFGFFRMDHTFIRYNGRVGISGDVIASGTITAEKVSTE